MDEGTEEDFAESSPPTGKAASSSGKKSLLGSWLRLRRPRGAAAKKQKEENRRKRKSQDGNDDDVDCGGRGRVNGDVYSHEAGPSTSSSSSAVRRDLPPLPPPSEAPIAVAEGDLVDAAGLSASMEELMAHANGEGETAFLAPESDDDDEDEESRRQRTQLRATDFSESLQAVKNYGWYWGPISGDVAERLLSTEPDGSFLVRDSSDHHYIFSLTFKLSGKVRHVRIEHDQGNFSFGTSTKFKSRTIVEFIECAVAHSRSGRFLFFLHRQPAQLGPLRVQLLNPVSRFKTVQSLQHQCRFVILKLVPRDLLHRLPLPAKVQEYLNTPHYYSEQMEEYRQREENAAESDSPAPASQSQSPTPNHQD